MINNFEFHSKDYLDVHKSINDLRVGVSEKLKCIPGIAVTKENGVDGLTRINFPDSGVGNVSLVMSHQNFYIVGFIRINKRNHESEFFKFSDAEFKKISIPGMKNITLDSNSHYNALSNIAGKDRGEIGVSKESIHNSVINLSKFDGGTKINDKVASSLLILATVTSEAVRIPVIQCRIAKSILLIKILILSEKKEKKITNDWSKTSKAILAINGFILREKGVEDYNSLIEKIYPLTRKEEGLSEMKDLLVKVNKYAPPNGMPVSGDPDYLINDYDGKGRVKYLNSVLSRIKVALR
ncbi:ribosome-inactivating family protein [Mycetohabitans sp. B5]|uniref:Ribosome inactivating protein n=1 Tax=Mycetohabitans endofungorum TaxID=417203 RepID=A0A2P5KAT4_9BURK|nr:MULTISPECIES: ribosome-inactivating family protein [Mycetohabitans]MCG1054769.1 ribosome-inactivating family protein [Mycetohabitans sp. B5]PPB83826.1 ribosome inactivating protein [Mycetohabitans endofungorum]